VLKLDRLLAFKIGKRPAYFQDAVVSPRRLRVAGGAAAAALRTSARIVRRLAAAVVNGFGRRPARILMLLGTSQERI
jgi:hypothetical protein